MALPSIWYRILIFHFFANVRALNSTKPQNSTLETHARFVHSPDSRGTLDILWSSLFTMLACTWTVQHLNVPAQRESFRSGWRGTFKWYLEKLGTSLKWLMITTIAPEVVIGMAYYDYVSAKKNLRDLEGFALEDNVPWTLTHSYFANMGAFVIQTENPEEPHRENYHIPYHLTGRQILQLRKKDILSSLPRISEEELKDRSKSDTFVKAIALFQILWAIVQIIVRTVRKLTVSQLELAVIAFAACAVVIYCFHWSKPQNIGATTTILQYDGSIPQEVLQSIKGRHTYMGYFLIADDSSKSRHGKPIRNDATEIHGGSEMLAYLAMILGAMLFGGIHAVGWNYVFPTRIELILWRCASVWTAAYGPTVIILALLLGNLGGNRRFLVCFQIFTFLYILARLTLLAEIFRTLVFLPPDAYISTWSSNIPHFE